MHVMMIYHGSQIHCDVKVAFAWQLPFLNHVYSFQYDCHLWGVEICQEDPVSALPLSEVGGVRPFIGFVNGRVSIDFDDLLLRKLSHAFHGLQDLLSFP
jgi:hypothetical protein